jgi:hypothetical protein
MRRRHLLKSAAAVFAPYGREDTPPACETLHATAEPMQD